MNTFPKDARVCFVGDSITHNNGFVWHIANWYRVNKPELKVEFYNCGISGGKLGMTLSVFEEDIAIYDPTHIVLMMGTNDSRRDYLEQPVSAKRYADLTDAYETFKTNLQTFYDVVRERNIQLTLCTPCPYAEYQDDDYSETPPLRGGYALVQSYANYILQFAKANDLPVLDMHEAMTKAIQTEILYRPDRVHPIDRGHAVMAQIFLGFQGIDYEPAKSFLPELTPWADSSRAIRDIMHTEFLVLKEFQHMSHEERLETIRERSVQIETGEFQMDPLYVGYTKNMMKIYLKHKPLFREHMETIFRVMKNQ